VRVLIVGAGVGGLAAARALGADGHRVIVFERAQGTRRAGAAVTLWSNGTGVLADLGVRLDGVGARIDALEQRTADGRLLLRVDVARSAARYGHPHLCLPRRRLLELMGNGLPAGTVQFGRRAVAVHEDADGARVEFEDGGAERGDLMIGADGRSSVVRERVWGRDPAEPSGWAPGRASARSRWR
jgi:FAD-dependent urate hydroxylase